MQLVLKSSQDCTLQFSTKVHLSITRSRCGSDLVAHGAGWLKVQWTLLWWLRASSGYSGSAQACSPWAQACSGSAQVCSPSAQIKAAAAHVQRLKRNRHEKKNSHRVYGYCDVRLLIMKRPFGMLGFTGRNLKYACREALRSLTRRSDGWRWRLRSWGVALVLKVCTFKAVRGCATIAGAAPHPRLSRTWSCRDQRQKCWALWAKVRFKLWIKHSTIDSVLLDYENSNTKFMQANGVKLSL
jgi:hypothetical protein